MPNRRKDITNHGVYGVIRTVIRTKNRVIAIKRTVLVVIGRTTTHHFLCYWQVCLNTVIKQYGFLLRRRNRCYRLGERIGHMEMCSDGK